MKIKKERKRFDGLARNRLMNDYKPIKSIFGILDISFHCLLQKNQSCD